MSLTVQLEEFFVTRLRIDWHQPLPEAEAEALSGEMDVDYKVMRHKEEKNRYQMQLSVSAGPRKEAAKAGWVVDARVEGYFVFPDGLERELMEMAIRLNGGIILYGILRGQVAAATGSFPAGKFVLPTIAMQDVIARKEGRRIRRKKPAELPGPQET